MVVPKLPAEGAVKCHHFHGGMGESGDCLIEVFKAFALNVTSQLTPENIPLLLSAAKGKEIILKIAQNGTELMHKLESSGIEMSAPHRSNLTNFIEALPKVCKADDINWRSIFDPYNICFVLAIGSLSIMLIDIFCNARHNRGPVNVQTAAQPLMRERAAEGKGGEAISVRVVSQP